MSLVRWRPARDWLNIREEVDRFFDDFFGRSLHKYGFDADSVWSPDVDLVETEDQVIATVELPGLSKDDVKVTLNDNILTIQGTKKQEREDKNEHYHRIERRFGVFERSFTIPASVEEKKIRANFKNGVLKIEMPKAPEAKRKAIPISVE